MSSLSAIVAGRDVSLRGDSDSPDRYGRQPAFVFVGSDTATVQGQLLAHGEALVAADLAAGDCRSELIAAATNARSRRF